jgi:hypothetical protein
MAKNRKDSFDFFLANERNRQSAFDENEEWKILASGIEQSPTQNAPIIPSNGGFLGKRASSEDRDIDLHSSENSYNLMSFLVKSLINKEKASLDELVSSVNAAYSLISGGAEHKSRVAGGLPRRFSRRR